MLNLQTISSAPDWLVSKVIMTKASNVQNSKSSTGILAGEMFSSGRRNKDLTSQAGLLRRNGASLDFIENVLIDINNKLSDPLPESEVLAIAKGTQRYEASNIESINHKSYAEFLNIDLKDRCLYCVGDGFYLYDDHVWQRDPEGLFILDSAANLSDKLLAQVETMKNDLDESAFKSLKGAVRRTQDTPFLMNAIRQFKAKKDVRSSYSNMNYRKDLLNLRNCVYNAATKEAEPHCASHKFTWKADFDFDSNATCPRFDQFLDEVLTKDVQRLLYQILALSLFGIDKEQIFVFLHGQTRNGKSTLIKIIEEMLSPLCANVEPSSFMAKAGDHIPNDLARLAGKRFVFTSETKLGNIMDAPLLKRMTGRDPLTVRFMRAEYFEFVPEFIPFIATNYLPVIDGSDIALRRRMVIIPFDRIIPEDQVDKGLHDKLKLEKSGILNRIIAGLADYNAEGKLSIPKSVSDRIDTYMDSSNMIKRFVDEMLDNDESTSLSARELHHYYSKWSEGYHLKPLSEPQFKLLFERTTGIMQEYNSRNRYWPNLRTRRLLT